MFTNYFKIHYSKKITLVSTEQHNYLSDQNAELCKLLVFIVTSSNPWISSLCLGFGLFQTCYYFQIRSQYVAFDSGFLNLEIQSCCYVYQQFVPFVAEQYSIILLYQLVEPCNCWRTFGSHGYSCFQVLCKYEFLLLLGKYLSGCVVRVCLAL